jgi:cyclopropane-fatty-acyl-phospholipid synthase
MMSNIGSTIAWGKVYHRRSTPILHVFKYDLFTFIIDVDDIDKLKYKSWLFAVDSLAVFTLRRQDYRLFDASSGELSLRQDVTRLLREHGYVGDLSSISLFTMPRFFGYVFNPVSFFLCRDADNQIIALLTQVQNTFGEMHLYPLICSPSAKESYTWNFSKQFYVSPFFAVEGDYELTVNDLADRFMIEVRLLNDSTQIFYASLDGLKEPLSVGRLAQTIIKFPLTTLLTMIRIHWQAVVLIIRKKVKIFDKPKPITPLTYRARVSWIYQVRNNFLVLVKYLRGY